MPVSLLDSNLNTVWAYNSQPANYYDAVAAFYALYYRTGIDDYLTAARKLADRFWKYRLDSGPRAGSRGLIRRTNAPPPNVPCWKWSCAPRGRPACGPAWKRCSRTHRAAKRHRRQSQERHLGHAGGGLIWRRSRMARCLIPRGIPTQVQSRDQQIVPRNLDTNSAGGWRVVPDV